MLSIFAMVKAENLMGSSAKALQYFGAKVQPLYSALVLKCCNSLKCSPLRCSSTELMQLSSATLLTYWNSPVFKRLSVVTI
jgi:hypothetical protein